MRRVLLTLFAAGAILLAIPFLIGCEQPLEPAADGADAPSTGEDPVPEPDGPPEDPPERQEIAIDFDGETTGYVGAAFDGSGIAKGPAEGFLDADGWEIVGFSDGDLTYGEEADSGDFARGTSAGGVSAGGLYAFTVGDGNNALGVQSTGSDFAPGSLGVRLPLTVDVPARVSIAFTLWERNDEDRATKWTCEISADGVIFAGIDELTHVTGEAATGEAWTRHDLEALVDLDGVDPDAVDLAQTGTLYVRWSATDESGTGSRDEAAIDDIVVAVESG